jgi:hypothetical protein
MNESNLWQAIYELYVLLLSNINDEASYQQFFERNPIVFRTLGYDAHASFEQSSGNSLPFDDERGYRPTPDFLCARSGIGELTIFELKTPNVAKLVVSRADGIRAKLSAEAEGYLSQSTEYAESIAGREVARDVVLRTLILDRIAAYRIVLVYGREQDNNPADVVRLLANRTKIPAEILFYDRLLTQLGEAYERGRGDMLSRTGWCFVFHVAFPHCQDNKRAYLCDCGEVDKHRLSIYLESDVLYFDIVDADGDIHRLNGRMRGSTPHYVRFEFASDSAGV